MKKLSLLSSLLTLGVLLAAGVALAANVRCERTPRGEEPSPCVGTAQSDKMRGSGGDDEIRARQGNDLVNAFDGNDDIIGGTGADRLNGNSGADTIIASAFDGSDFEELKFFDNSNDILHGGADADVLYGGFGQGGRDRVFGDGGNDTVIVAQRAFRAEGAETKITREKVDCGPGRDTVLYDEGIDIIDEESCETLFPYAPNGQVVPPEEGQRSAASAELLEFPF